jgi:hypothetical protein
MLPLEFYRDNKEDASKYLATALRKGSLALFLGAGASASVGLPEWGTLMHRCLGRPDSEAPKDAAGVQKLRLEIDDIEAQLPFEEYANLIRKKLYQGITLTFDLVREPLLIAIGALTMPSRRGSARTVVTLNFDDVLERYLSLHGFFSQVVSTLPTLLTEADITVYHPNGFIPYNAEGQQSEFVVLSERSFEKRMSVFESHWRRFVTEQVQSRIGVFIGLSGNDPILGPALADAKDSVGGKRPTGFWLRGPAPERPDSYFLTRNVVPLNFESYDDYAPFLMGVCQAAFKEACG